MATKSSIKYQPGHQIQWKIPAIQAYLRDQDQFLELLLLLCHITGGQPARGTEILSLRHRNTIHGRHRSIFIEQGLISMVTSYNKGYHVTGSTKIIHRYLPRELILPFCEKLEILAFKKTEPPSPFLWPKAHRREREEDSSYLTIAISRAHLPSGGFKQDYRVNKKTAGTIYARGLKKAPGHVEECRTQY
ncbi:hypothetical protein TSTA_000270 [Talaromyces stipitatus ATCC 10500]|uniref:Uncharacterized protein n=1 Tax=Talaromyces stipitatus (strain ATCC 10500 / CBS 375.48 / QM 6759 / NRRL 1006) TaxID=441959 RepID=B8MSF4_TALSN|nr:uncharacterized protein TSTA_000270 [Talaromyces stipitatus ATCC 10500]EED11949.1 hypothetical protein TSTA_000270 [Talaromyces stipitatus ATCC 10500]